MSNKWISIHLPSIHREWIGYYEWKFSNRKVLKTTEMASLLHCRAIMWVVSIYMNNIIQLLYSGSSLFIIDSGSEVAVVCQSNWQRSIWIVDYFYDIRIFDYWSLYGVKVYINYFIRKNGLNTTIKILIIFQKQFRVV